MGQIDRASMGSVPSHLAKQNMLRKSCFSVMEKIIEVGLALQERLQRTDEPIVEVPLPQITEDCVEEFKTRTTGAIFGKDL